jgi:tetratricopeptide (TPR) repeat protein
MTHRVARLGLVVGIGLWCGAIVFARQEATPTADAAAVVAAVADAGWTLASFPAMDFPTGTVPAANEVVAQAVEALNKGMGAEPALTLLEGALALDPAHPFAWWRLGSLQLFRQHDLGVRNMRHQIDVAPSAAAYKHAAFILHTSGFDEESLPFWREGIAHYPNDRELPALYGETLLAVADYPGAAAVLAAEVGKHPGSSRLRLNYGRALFRTGKTAQAVAEFKQAAALEPVPDMWTSVASALAEAGDLDTALDCAQRAVTATEARVQTLELPERAGGIFPADMTRLVSAWAALGQVLLARGDLDAAETYTSVAWELSASRALSYRLGQIHEKRDDPIGAARFYAFGMFRPAGFPTVDLPSAVRLTDLVPDAQDRSALASAAAAERTRLWTLSLDRTGDLPATGVAFNLIVDAGGIVTAVGATTNQGPAETGQALAQRLVGRRVGPELPRGGTRQILRRGWIACAAGQPVCRVSLYDSGRLLTGT